jgi:histone H3/H4
MSSQKLKNPKKTKEAKRDVLASQTSDYDEEGFEVNLENSKMNLSNTDEIETPVQTPISSKKKENKKKEGKEKKKEGKEKKKDKKKETQEGEKPEGIKKKKMHHTYTSSMNQKDKMQGLLSGTKNIFTKSSIALLIKESMHSKGSESLRITRGALDLLHEKIEQHMTNLFWTANILSLTKKRSTLTVPDLQLANLIQKGELNMNIHKSKIDSLIPEKNLEKKK